MDPRITCPQCQNKLSITGISRMINCSFSQENFIRITCPQCRSPLSITWISTAIPFLIGQALIRIMGDGYLGKEQMISPSITENAAPVASSNGKPSSVLLSPGSFPAIQGAASPNLRPHRTFPTAPSTMLRVRQRAVLCGVTYSKMSNKYKLKGTVDDVKIMKEFLMRRFQFPEEGIRVLTEEQGNPLSPTKKNIQDSLHWLVRDCQYGDSLVFFFSGHGLRQPDFDGDEIDGFDKTICPVDFMWEGMILDNEINDIIVRPLRRGVTLHAIVDACHSGTTLDLPSVYDNRQAKWVDSSPPNGAYRGTSGGLAISLSTCVDDRIADTLAFGRKTMKGAMTNSFTKSINENPNITYGQLLITIQREITKANDCYCLNNLRLTRVSNNKLSQEVLLSSSMEFNVSRTKFSFYPVIDKSWR